MQQVTFFQLAKKSFALLFGGIFLVFGCPFFMAGVWALVQERQFENQARIAQAMVLTREIHHSSKGGTRYSITYRFTTAQGRTLKGSGKVSFKVWQSLEEKGPVSVLYLPDKPSSNRVQGETNWFGSLIFIPFGSVFMLIGGIVFFFGLRNCLRRLRLSRDGLTA